MTTRILALTTLALLVACGAPPTGTAPTPHADGVYVGAIADSDALIAIVIEGNDVAAYTCGGEDTWEHLTGWYTGTVNDGRIDDAVGTTGWRLEATRTGNRWNGSLTRLDQTFSFSAEPAAPGTAAGLYVLDTASREAGLIIDNDLNTAGVYYGKDSGARSTVSVRDDLDDASERSTVRVDTDAYGGSSYTLSRNDRTFTRAMFTLELATARVDLDGSRNATAQVTITPRHGFSGVVHLTWDDPVITVEPSSVTLADGAATTLEALITLDADTPARAVDAVLGASSGNLSQFAPAAIELPTPEPWWHVDAFADAYASSRIYAVSSDALGFTYVVGVLHDPVGTEQSGAGPFLARYNPDGARVWKQMLGGGTPSAIAHGPGNTIYLAGNVDADDEGWTGEAPAGLRAGFVQRMTSAGDVMWRVMFDTDGDDHLSWRADRLAVDASGNVVVVGVASFSPPFDSDVFVAKVSDLGTPLWLTLLDSGERDYAGDVAVDVGGTVYVSGRWHHPYIAYGNPNETWGVGFLARFDAGGNHQWTSLFDSGHDAGSSSSSVDLDPQGRPVVGGSFFYYVEGYSYPRLNGFVAQYDVDGALLWNASISTIGAGAPMRCWSSAHQQAMPACNSVNAVRVTNGGLIYAAGNTSGWLNEPGENNAGTQDTFLAQFSPTGAQVWAHVYGSSDGHDGTAQSGGLAIDGDGNAYLAGTTDLVPGHRAFILRHMP